MNSHISSTPQKGYCLRQASNNASEDHFSQKQEANLEQNQSKRAGIMNKSTLQNGSKKNILDSEEKDSNEQNKKSYSCEQKNNENIEKEEKELRSENQEGKNQRHQSSEQIRESRQNETNQLPVAASKKCFNKQCTSKKIYRKIRSRVEAGKYRFLCKTCYQSYNNNYFCQFCQQLYSNQYDQEDMHKWIGCDSCERWNHIQCEKKHRFKSLDINQELKYECLGCSRKSRNFDDIPKKKVQKDETIKPNKIKFQINRQDRISIFHKKPESFPHLQPFLQAYNFRLWINDALIRDDLDNLRSTIHSGIYEQQPKKTKKVKIQ